VNLVFHEKRLVASSRTRRSLSIHIIDIVQWKIAYLSHTTSPLCLHLFLEGIQVCGEGVESVNVQGSRRKC